MSDGLGFPPQTPMEKKMTRYIMVDVETDGPIPGDYSMIAIGAVVVEDGLSRTFKAYLRPISNNYQEEALAVGGFTRIECLKDEKFMDPHEAMGAFGIWINSLGIKSPIFIADNNGFDWMFVCWYFHHFMGKNPFGFSSQNLNSLYKGLTKDAFASFKHLRKTKHTHDPVDDAMGNAEALLHMISEMGYKAAK
jgi:DNA polymerase III epsilon subunit-like protein